MKLPGNAVAGIVVNEFYRLTYYGTAIERVSFDDKFVVHTGEQRLATSDHLVLGLGTVPYPTTARSR